MNQEENFRFLSKEEIEKMDKIREINKKRIEERAKRFPELERKMLNSRDEILKEIGRGYGRLD